MAGSEEVLQSVPSSSPPKFSFATLPRCTFPLHPSLSLSLSTSISGILFVPTLVPDCTGLITLITATPTTERRGFPRDWNAAFQSLLEMEDSDESTRLLKNEKLSALWRDFVHTAKSCASNVFCFVCSAVAYSVLLSHMKEDREGLGALIRAQAARSSFRRCVWRNTRGPFRR